MKKMTKNMTYPTVIQGGMGVYISNWELSREVSILGGLGTISGVMLERILAYKLQRGDLDGSVRRALSHFPYPEPVNKVMDAYFVEGGISKKSPFKAVSMYTIKPSELLISLTVCANFAFVWLAKEGHDNPISINYLEKVAMPHVCAITGAMLANVDFITMGAGIALHIPEVINAISEGRTAEYRVPVEGENIKNWTMEFNPKTFFGSDLPMMVKPGFIPIISSNSLASVFMTKLPPGSIYGFVVEEPSAAGHNASPRKLLRNDEGEPLPIYGSKDQVNYEMLALLGIPFWIGGSCASPERLKWALSVGAKGIQVGSIFALSEESGLDSILKRKARKLGFNKILEINTDMRISPTGYPFKVAKIGGTISEHSVYKSRMRVCNQGGLVSLYEKSNGSIGYRCSAEPIDKFISKDGDIKETINRGCLCNALFSAANFNNPGEVPVVTLGDDLSFLSKLMTDEDSLYYASDVIKYLIADL